MKTAIIIGAAAAGGFGLWWLLNRNSAAAAAAAAPPPKPAGPSLNDSIINTEAAGLNAVLPGGGALIKGEAALYQKLPTAGKIALAIGTGGLANLIADPVGTATAAKNVSKTVVKSIASGASALVPGHSSCSGDCSKPKTVAEARALVNAVPTFNGLRDCIRSICSQRFGVQI